MSHNLVHDLHDISNVDHTIAIDVGSRFDGFIGDLTPHVEDGTMRETYFASQLGVGHQLSMPSQGDLVVDGRWLFEVGGKSKGFKQIKGIEDSYVVSDGIDIGHGKKIPLWLFGLLY